jgi:putative ABC transport system permease protein
VIAYATTRRRHEFGVRLALGASPGQVIALLLREGVVLAGTGVVFGVMGAVLAANALRSQLFGVTPYDITSFAVAVVAIAAAALIACWIPAWRTTAISPSEALRSEAGL